MKTRYFALIVGIFFVLVAILGCVPGLVSSPSNAPAIAVHDGYGYLLGLFPINILHNFVLLAVGLLDIFAYFSFSVAQLYARGLAIFYGSLAVMGLIPATNTTFNLIPIFGNDVWLHAATALFAAYLGYMAPEKVEEVNTTTV